MPDGAADAPEEVADGLPLPAEVAGALGDVVPLPSVVLVGLGSDVHAPRSRVAASSREVAGSLTGGLAGVGTGG